MEPPFQTSSVQPDAYCHQFTLHCCWQINVGLGLQGSIVSYKLLKLSVFQTPRLESQFMVAHIMDK